MKTQRFKLIFISYFEADWFQSMKTGCKMSNKIRLSLRESENLWPKSKAKVTALLFVKLIFKQNVILLFYFHIYFEQNFLKNRFQILWVCT